MQIRPRHVALFMMLALCSTAAVSQNAFQRFRDRLSSVVAQLDKNGQKSASRNQTTPASDKEQNDATPLASGERLAGPDLLGIQLGMTREQVLETLRRRHPTVVQKEHYGVICGSIELRISPCKDVSYRNLSEGTTLTVSFVDSKHHLGPVLNQSWLRSAIAVRVEFSQKGRFSFKPSALVERKYGAFTQYQHAMIKVVTTGVGKAKITYKEYVDSATKQITQYSIVMLIDLHSFLHRHDAKAPAIAAPSL